MDDGLRFATDLYQGTAGYYDRYRRPYPEAMIGWLTERAVLSGDGRLLDLACGTGQLTFPLRRSFSEVWSVDREPGMVDAVRAKAAATAAGSVRAIAADAETLDAEPGHFELAVIGNAFHRPDHQVLSDAGFEQAERQEFTAEHRWSLRELAGYVRSTSVLPDSVLGDQGTAFDADLAASLGPLADCGTFAQSESSACELARKPFTG